jgi:hypothetical protein
MYWNCRLSEITPPRLPNAETIASLRCSSLRCH